VSEERAEERLVVDGNAAAGVLEAAFGEDVSAHRGTCAHCGTVSVVGTLRAWVRGPGVVLRCPACSGVVIRIAQTPSGLRVDRAGVRDLGAEPRA
jgi:hypothetical protein